MSAALSEPINVEHHEEKATAPSPERHLHPVREERLRVEPVPPALANDMPQTAAVEHALVQPAEEFAPAPGYARPVPHSNVVYLHEQRAKEAQRQRHLLQVDSIKKMTQTIGAGFVEAELGLRPFAQLGSWLELGLFHKLRARVEHAMHARKLIGGVKETQSKKVPSIVPIAVRADPRECDEWETSMTIKVGERARAIAMRIQLHRDRWRVIALEIG